METDLRLDQPIDSPLPEGWGLAGRLNLAGGVVPEFVRNGGRCPHVSGYGATFEVVAKAGIPWMQRFNESAQARRKESTASDRTR